MYGNWTEYVVLYTHFLEDSFERYKTYLRRIFTEFEYVFRTGFFKLFINDDKNCKQNSTVN